MFAIIARFRSVVLVVLTAILLAGPSHAIDFEFLYDDPTGTGFLDPVQGETRRNALAAAGDIWGRLIPPSYAGETVTIRIKFQNLGGGLANGAPNYFYSDFGSSNPAYQEDVNYPKALANHLASRDLAPERHEAEINVDSMTKYYYGTAGTPAADEFDFISVMAHEIGHGLGFYSTFQEDGEYGILGDRSHTEPICPGCLPTPYDLFLTLGGFGPTLISYDDDEARQPALTSDSLFWNGANGAAGNALMGKSGPPKIYAPATFSETSSISHTDDGTYANTIMISALGIQQITQTPTAVERGILRDMGWTISVTPSTVNWTGLGADNLATTTANWSPRLPKPGDNLAFDASPITDVQMNLFLGTLGGISFPATAPAYTLRFKSNMDIALTGSGIINFSLSAQTIFLESSLQDDPTPALYHSAAALTFTGPVGMAGANAGNADYHLRGGGTSIAGIAPPHGTYYFDRYPGASVTFERNSTAGSASFEIEGGAGDGGPNAIVTFRDNAIAAGAEFRTKGGRLGPSLPLGTVAVGFGGEVRFEDKSKAGSATFHNEGQAEYFNGAGGFTIFTDDSTAENAEIHNHGATYSNGFGGATYFSDKSTAGAAHIFNHADGTNSGSTTGARTVFEDSSKAGTAIIENEGAPSQAARHGRTEFHNNSSAEGATINNRGYINVGDLAGRTLFYDDTTADTATLRTFNGYSDHGRIEFHDRSTAADAHIFIDNDPMVTASHGGYLTFFNDSTAARSEITLRSGSAGFGGLQFYNNATAADAQIVTENNSGSIIFYGNSIAGDPPTADTPETANFSLGRGSGMAFYDQATADDAIITVANGAFLNFNMSSSAGQAQIGAAGSSAYPTAGGLITFNSTATVNGATIFAQGGTAPLAEGANVYFINGAHAGNATITLTGGTNGGGGARLTFNAAAKGDTARLIAHAGATVDFFDQRIYGDTAVGSIEGAGAFWLRGSLLTTGNRNTSTTVSGPIIDHPTGFVTGGRLTKVGDGTLTLAGVNTYSGLTTVAGGTLRVDGSIAGDAFVENGATLGGTGTIGGAVTVNPGGVFAPGASPGTITIDALTMNPGGILNFELGDSARDHIVLDNNGNVALDGILNISLVGDFVPMLGQSFSLFEGAIGSVTGMFDLIDAPIVNGLTFDVMQNASSVMLQVVDSTFLAGDFNRDGTVDGADLANWRAGYGTPGGATYLQGDADADDDVDGGDFLVWQRQLGSGPLMISSSSAVPEPASGILLGISVLGIVAAMRRRAAPCGAVALSLALAVPAAADYSVQDNIAFNARKINPYTGGPAWELSDTVSLLDESFGPVTIGPLNADPLGLALETLFGVDLPHVVKLQTGASLSGNAKVEFGYYVTAGRLDISYPASANLDFQTAPGTTNVVQANQTYGIDGGFLPGVSQRSVLPQFLQTQGGAGYATAPLRSQTEYQQPWFETQSPWASAWVEASANVQSSIFTKVSALGGLKEWRKDIRAGGNVGGRLVEIDPNGLYVAGEEVVGFDLTEPIGPIPIGGGAADLTIQVPNIAVSSVTNGNLQGPVIGAYKEQPLVTLTGNLERLIPFVGTILQNQIGPLGYDLLNLAGGPQLSLYQEMTFTPDPKVRLTFSEPVIVGGSNTPTLQAEFDLDAAINWKPLFSNSSAIEVTPTYLLNNTFRNETGLNLDLVLDVEALSLTGDFPPFNGTLGPAYAERVTIPIFEGGELFAPQFNIPLGSVTGGSVPGIGPITTGVIEFQKSNLDIQVGLGDMQLITDEFVSPDPNNPGYEIHNLEFTRAVDGGAPRQYQATVSGQFGIVIPEGADDDVGASYLLTLQDVVVTDPVTSEPINLGRNFILDSDDLSPFLPAQSPAYVDPNPNLGKLYVTTLPDDLSFVPNVDVNATGHPQLDQYNAVDDFIQDSTVEEPTEVIDRGQYPTATILVRSGEVVPSGVSRINSISAVTMNENGGVAYSPNLTVYPPDMGTNGFYFTDEAGNAKLARAGDPVPGGSGTITISSVGSIALNDAGQAALLLGMSNSFSNSLVLRNGPDGPKVIARNGQTAPDGDGTFQGFGSPALNNSGQMLFWSQVTPDDVLYFEGLYVSDSIALSEIAREGDAAPGMPGLMESFGYYSLNNSGQAAFDVSTTGNVQGLYIRDGNNLHLIAADGGAVPQGGEFVGINDQDLNEAGQVAFAAGLRTSPGGPLKFGVFRGDGNSLVQIAREGQLAPDGDGTLKSSGLFEFQLNDSGQVAFVGSVDAATDYEAILIGNGGSLNQIARYGMTAPDGNGQISGLSGIPQLNNQGHVAFQTNFNTPGNDNAGILVYDGANVVQVVRTGQPLAGSAVSNVTLAGINEDMQVAYRANLADGRTVIARFEPTLYWRNAVSGNWGSADSWSLGVEPINPYDVFIVAENALTVAGPAVNRTVKSLTLGADDSASVGLHLVSNVTLTTTNGTRIRRNGVVTGFGTLAGSVANEGLISPGASPGALHIDGDFTQSSNGTLLIEMASATNYDRLLISGDVVLGGTLAVSLLDGFIPTEGQQFSIFGDQIDSITGTFNFIQFPTFNGLTFAVSQNINSIMLQVVEATLPGDFNGDGAVDAADLNNWKAGFGKSAGATNMQGDADGDLDVDGADFLVWQRQLGSEAFVASNLQMAPEPTSALLAVAILIAAIAGRAGGHDTARDAELSYAGPG